MTNNFFIHFFITRFSDWSFSLWVTCLSKESQNGKFPQMCDVLSHWCGQDVLRNFMIHNTTATLYHSNTPRRYQQSTFREYTLRRSEYFQISLINEYQAKLPGTMIVKTELWKKWIKKLFHLTFLFEKIFPSGQKYHSCPARKSLKNAKIMF